MNKHNIKIGLKSQYGAVLVLSMILLLVLTLLGLSSMRTATMEERMAGNMRDRNLSFEAAEYALREGEEWIDRQTNPADINSQAFTYSGDNFSAADLASTDWWTNNQTADINTLASGTESFNGVSTQPEFIVGEQTFIADSLVRGYSPPSGKQVYRVIAKGTGGTDSAVSVTESTFTKRFN